MWQKSCFFDFLKKELIKRKYVKLNSFNINFLLKKCRQFIQKFLHMWESFHFYRKFWRKKRTFFILAFSIKLYRIYFDIACIEGLNKLCLLSWFRRRETERNAELSVHLSSLLNIRGSLHETRFSARLNRMYCCKVAPRYRVAAPLFPGSAA